MVLHTEKWSVSWSTSHASVKTELAKTYESRLKMSDWGFRNEYLYNVSAKVMCEFTTVMDTLSDSEWHRFASHVLSSQDQLRLASRSDRRTDYVVNVWANQKGTVGDLLSVLEKLKLYRPRDIILSEVPYPIQSRPKPPPELPQPKPPPLPKPDPPPPHLDSQKKEVDTKQPPSALCWPFEEVQRGTDNFADARKIGEGGFGEVFRAGMRKTDYAVKRLKEDSRLNWTSVKESFHTELEKLPQYPHPNIVEFAGYCVGAGTYCILYVFMPNGSLEDQLHCKNSAALCWPQRVNILLGSARAIQFLHNSKPQLIHGDVKSSNILLGEHLEAKLGDFGLARFCHSTRGKAVRTTTVAQTRTVRGTLAYLPDEYVQSGELGLWTDTYSFGVVLLEVLTGRRAMELDGRSRMLYLKDLVAECEEEEGGAARHIWMKRLDPRIFSASEPAPAEAMELCTLACRCLDRRKKKRPSMTEVFDILDKISAKLGSSREYTSKPDISSVPMCQSSGRQSSGRQPSGRQPSGRQSPAPGSESLSVDQSIASLTKQALKLGPQEDTFHCPLNLHSVPPPPETLGSHAPSSWGPSSQVPCESDESQGFSQYFASTQSSLCHPSNDEKGAWRAPRSDACLPEAASSLDSAQGDGAKAGRVTDLSNRKIVINAVRQQFVQKMALCEEGIISISDLLSFDSLSEAGTSRHSQVPEESDESESMSIEASGTSTHTPAS